MVLEQIGSMELDHAYWGRPEDMEFYNISRPAFLINTEKPGSDMAAQAAAALAASSKVSLDIWKPFVELLNEKAA